MTRHAAIIPVFAAAALLSAPALASGNATAENTMMPRASNTVKGHDTAADKDFGKFSKQGASAMADIDMARIAIFDGQTKDATQDLALAKTALDAAQSDATVFERAEADLHPPKSGMNAPAAGATQSIKWLPVGGSMTLDENYVATPEKQKAVADANARLKQGDKASARDTLKLHNIDLAFDLRVVPLQKTMDSVKQAANYADNGKFFQADQVLRSIDDSVRVDEQVYTAAPNHLPASK